MNESANSGSGVKPARAPQRAIWLVAAAVVGAGLAIASQLQCRLCASEDSLPVLGEVPDFTLTDAAGAPFGRAQLAGQVWTANLFFTSCPSICPPITRNLVALQNGIGQSKDFDLVSISVDPERDTPAVMAAFAAEYGADTNRWHFLTGSLDTIAELSTKGLKLGAMDQPATHSPYIALIDSQGRIRSYYDALDSDAMAKLKADLQVVRPNALRSEIHMETVLPTAGLGPQLTVSLNSLSALLLLAGFLAIKSKRVRLHRAIMLGALASSTAFLAVYLTHHAISGSTRYPFHDWTRTLYFWILIPHTILAMVMVPFILRGVWLAFRARFDAHRRLMRWVWPAWFYVSVTGVIVYVMLYVWPHWRERA